MNEQMPNPVVKAQGEDPQKNEDDGEWIAFNYPDGTVGRASSRAEVSKMLAEYREAQK